MTKATSVNIDVFSQYRCIRVTSNIISGTANMSAIFGENVAMDTFLQQLVENKQFELLSNKNWDAMSHMFPGTTPYQVS